MSPSDRSSGIARREFLQVGFSGVLGLGLPGLLAARARAGAAVGRGARARSMILVFLTGGLSHIDSFDMKPDAPDGIRGEFQPIDTTVAGAPDLRAPAAAWRRGPTSWRSSGRCRTRTRTTSTPRTRS